MASLQAKSVYREYVSHPGILEGHLSLCESQGKESPDLFSVTTVWGQKNVLRQEEDRFKTGSLIRVAHTNVVPLEASTFPMLTQAQIEIPSPSGDLQAVVLPPSETEGNAKKQILQIYTQQTFIQSFDLAKSHGNVNIGDLFSGVSWSPGEDKLVYAAEEKRAKSRSFFSEKSPDTSLGDVTPGREYEYHEHWGEQMRECFSPQIFILDRGREEVRMLENLPEEYSFGQPIFADNNSIVCIGVRRDPFRLGLRACFNRTGYLFHLALDGSFCDRLGDNGRLAFAPRFSPARDLLVFLDQSSHGPHMSECRVMAIDWKTKQLNLVVESPDTALLGLRGLFCYSLPRNCFSADGCHLFLSSYSQAFGEIYSVSLQEQRISQVTNEPGTWTLLDVCQNLLLASFSTPNTPPLLKVGVFHEGAINQWVQVTERSSYCRFRQLKWEVRKFVVSDNSEQIDAIIVHPLDLPKGKKAPLAVCLHGGPHSPCTAQFSLWVSCLARLGFFCLVPNFRGTIGYSRSSIRSLIGKVGRQDVDDVQRTVEHVLSEGLCDPERVVCFGGSHGGFIAAHLVGQFPKVYKAAVMRNPVTNLASMVGVTDIPDWCYLECGHEYTQSTILTGEVLDSMLSKSPIIYAKEVQASLLIFLGERDCRVPNSQGLAYFRLLKSLGRDVRLLSYPKSNHSLGEAPVEADGFVNGISFLLEAIST